MRRLGVNWGLYGLGCFLCCLVLFVWVAYALGLRSFLAGNWFTLQCFIQLFAAMARTWDAHYKFLKGSATERQLKQLRGRHDLSYFFPTLWTGWTALVSVVSLVTIGIEMAIGRLSWASVTFWAFALPTMLLACHCMMKAAMRDSEAIAALKRSEVAVF